MHTEVRLLQRTDLGQLLLSLQSAGYLTVGPVVRDQAIVYDTLTSLADLPEGIGDRQEKGVYRLRMREDHALFGYTVGPQSWKKYLYPPRQLLMRAEKTAEGLQIQAPQTAAPKYALIGVRGCELSAIQIQDRVFLDGPFSDPFYRERREQVFILAVNCTEPGQTCFCASMETGPTAGPGYDLALTEMGASPDPFYLARAGTARGEALLQSLGAPHAAPEQCQHESERWQAASHKMGRNLDPVQARQVLQQDYDSPFWQDVGERCLSCSNCTLVCPTCFCSGVQEVTDLSGSSSERWREWDSCFSLNFTYTAGRAIRQSTGSRYRQWLSHKLSTWYEQFDSSGCVGCGRCITWCPVGIDLTAEIAILSDKQAREEGKVDGN